MDKVGHSVTKKPINTKKNSMSLGSVFKFDCQTKNMSILASKIRENVHDGCHSDAGLSEKER